MSTYATRKQTANRTGYTMNNSKSAHNNNNSPPVNNGEGPKEFGDQSWKLTKFRYGRTRFMCAACDSRNFNNPQKVETLPDGYTRVTEDYCPSCSEGNIYVNNVYRKYFSRQATENQ